MFDERKESFNLMLRPPLLGLDPFVKPTKYIALLLVAILVNGFTYLLNLRLWLPTNLIGFWVLAFLIIMGFYRFKMRLDNFLEWAHERLNDDISEKQAANKIDEVKDDSRLLKDVKITLLPLSRSILMWATILLTLLGIILPFVKKDYIQSVQIWIENNIIPFM